MEQDSAINIRYIIDLVWRRALFWFVPSALVIIVGVAFVFSLPRAYLAQATIQVESQRLPMALMEPAHPNAPPVHNDQLQQIEQRVMTRDNLLRIARKFDLFPELRASLTPAKFVDLMRASTKVERVDFGPFARPQNSPTFAFRVGFEHGDPQVATAVVADLVALILSQDNEVRLARAHNVVVILEQEAAGVRGELVRVEADMLDYSRKNAALLQGGPDFQLTQLEARKRELEETDTAIRTVDEEKRLLDLELRLKVSTGSGVSGDGQSLGAKLDTLKSQLVEKSSVYSDSHPEIRSLKQQITVLEDQIAAAIQAVSNAGEIDPRSLPPEQRLIAERVGALASRRTFLANRRNALVSSIASLQEVVAKAPEAEAGLRELERRRELARTNLEQMNAKLAAAQLQERLEKDERLERIRLLEPPELPEYPSQPNRRKLLVMVLAAAAAAGGGTMFAVDLLDPTLRGPADLRRAGATMGIITIPSIRSRHERERRRRQIDWGIGAVLVAQVVAVILVHTFYMPIGSILEKLSNVLVPPIGG